MHLFRSVPQRPADALISGKLIICPVFPGWIWSDLFKNTGATLVPTSAAEIGNISINCERLRHEATKAKLEPARQIFSVSVGLPSRWFGCRTSCPISIADGENNDPETPLSGLFAGAPSWVDPLPLSPCFLIHTVWNQHHSLSTQSRSHVFQS